MLVLTRKKDETIWLDDEVQIVVIDAREGRVRIGIEAPKNIKILRGELIWDDLSTQSGKRKAKSERGSGISTPLPSATIQRLPECEKSVTTTNNSASSKRTPSTYLKIVSPNLKRSYVMCGACRQPTNRQTILTVGEIQICQYCFKQAQEQMSDETE